MKTTLFVACCLTACATSTGALAGPPALYYYDDGVRRPVAPVDGLVAELGAPETSALKAALPRVEVVTQAKGAVLFKAAPSDARVALEKLRTTPAKVSPVYREGGVPAGRLMALPGGVVVSFKAEWTEAQVAAWLAERKLTIGERLSLAGNWYVVPTAPGEAALTTANSIQESGAVLSATPNWWKDTAAK